MNNFGEEPNITPEVIPDPDPHEPEMPPSMADVDIEEFLKRQEGINKKKESEDKPMPQ